MTDMSYQLKFPKKRDYPFSLKILDKPNKSVEYHQLVEASASAYFETRDPARWLFMKRFEIALNYLNQIKPVNNLLDVGTGIGFFLPTLASKAKSVTALDYAKHTLKYAKAMCKKKGIKNVKFIQDNLFKPRFTTKQFDVIMALSILEHVPPKDLPKVIGYLKKMIKPGGYLIAGYPNEGSIVFKLVQQAEKLIMRPKMLKSIKDDKRDYHPLGHVANSGQIDEAIKSQFKILNYKSLPTPLLKFYSLSLNQRVNR